MTSDFTHRIVYRKDERGVILDSAVVGPDDEMPEGFEDSTEYETPRLVEGEAPPLEESKLTSWEGRTDLRQTITEILGQEGDPGGFRSSGDLPDVTEDDTVEGREGVEFVGEPTGDEVRADDGSAENDSSQTVDEILGDRQEGTTNPGGVNDDADGSEQPDPAQQAVAPSAEGEQAAEEPSGESAEGSEGPPPQSGAGSGKDAWRQYADRQGVQVSDDASRDEIIGAVDKAGKPV